MKHKGSVSQTYIRRDNEVIPSLFRRAVALAEPPFSVERLSVIAANLPVSQFYISDDAAIAYIRSRVLNGRIPKFRSQYKKMVFEALYEIVTDMMQSEKYCEHDIPAVTVIALSRPAPCIGLTPNAIYQKYYLYRKKTRRLHHV